MVSFRAAANNMVPKSDPVDTAMLVQQMGLTRPASLHKLINTLNAHGPDSKVFDSGQLGPSTTTGWAQVGFTIDGGVAFRGSVHESGLIGHDYYFVMVIANYRDPSGKVVVFMYVGNVEGTSDDPLGSPKRDDSWNGGAIMDPFVAEHWDSIKASEWQANLSVDTKAGDVIKLVVESLFAGVVIAGIVLFTIAGAKGGGYHSEWTKDDHGNPVLEITPNEPPRH